MFFNGFNDYTRRIFYEDKDKHNVISWLIYNANYQEEYNNLKKYECYFTYSVLENDCQISRGKLQNIMKELENDGYIEWVTKSKVRHNKSILKLIFQYGKTYGNQYDKPYDKEYDNLYGEKYDKEYSKTTDSQELDEKANMLDNTVNSTVDSTVDNTINDTVDNTVRNTSSINISKNISNNNYEQEVARLWLLYPKKVGKKKAIPKIRKLVKQYGHEQLERCINRYLEGLKVETWRNPKNGDTFFTSGYEDYLDENYQEAEKEKGQEQEKEIDYINV